MYGDLVLLGRIKNDKALLLDALVLSFMFSFSHFDRSFLENLKWSDIKRVGGKDYLVMNFSDGTRRDFELAESHYEEIMKFKMLFARVNEVLLIDLDDDMVFPG